ncbi:hypothetical protein ACLOJK_024053 [Asimina triloba]
MCSCCPAYWVWVNADGLLFVACFEAALDKMKMDLLLDLTCSIWVPAGWEWCHRHRRCDRLLVDALTRCLLKLDEMLDGGREAGRWPMMWVGSAAGEVRPSTGKWRTVDDGRNTEYGYGYGFLPEYGFY